MMTTKQLIFVLIAFVFALFVLSIPLWADSMLPYLKNYLQDAVVRMQEMSAGVEK